MPPRGPDMYCRRPDVHWLSTLHRWQFIHSHVTYLPLLRDELRDVRVRAALRAACDRLEAVRPRAAVRVCRERARCDTPDRLSRFRVPLVARDRLTDGRLRRDLRVPFAFCADAVPFGGSDNFTPAFLALDNPIAIACLELRTPCFPSRT